jgi:hypothetical protein
LSDHRRSSRWKSGRFVPELETTIAIAIVHRVSEGWLELPVHHLRDALIAAYSREAWEVRRGCPRQPGILRG